MTQTSFIPIWSSWYPGCLVQKKRNNRIACRIIPAALTLLACLLIFIFPTGDLFAEGTNVQSLSAAALELDLSKRIESLVEKLVGMNRAIVTVKISLTMSQEAQIRITREKKQDMAGEETVNLRGLPGMAIAKTPLKQSGAAQRVTDYIRESQAIQKIAIKILLDDKLEADKINLVKETVPAWVGLDTTRGDTLEIQSVPWKEIQPLPIERLSKEQLSIGKNTFFIYISILIVLIIVVVTMTILGLWMMKLSKVKKQAGIVRDTATKEVASRIVSSIDKLSQDLTAPAQETQAPSGEGVGASDRVSSLLEEIKEILAQSATTAGAGGGGGGGTGGGGAGGGGGSSGAGGGGGGGGGGAGAGGGGGGLANTETLERTLKEIEEVLKEMSRKQGTGENPLDKPFEFINNFLSGQEVMKIAEGEKEEVLLHILANVNPMKSAEILSLLPEEKKLQTVTKMATLQTTTPEIVQSVREVMERKLKEARIAGGAATLDGSEVLAKILGVSSDEVMRETLEKLQKENPDLAKETRKRLFLFEDIATLDNKTLGLILSNTDRDTLKVALKHAPEEVLKKIFGAMSERGSAILKEDMEVLTEITPGRSSQAQRMMLEKINELEKEGLITLKKRSETGG